MTEVSPGDGGPGAGQEPDLDRTRPSKNVSADSGGASSVFDDDALADAMAAEVAAYTTPITLPPFARPVPVGDPGPDRTREPGSGATDDSAPDTAVPPVTPLPSSEPSPPEAEFSEVDLAGAASTLEAIERLESELRRLSGQPEPSPAATPAAEPPDRLFPRTYQPFRPAPADGIAESPEPTPGTDDHAEPTEPAPQAEDHAEPTEQAERDDPVEPTEQAEPVEPVEPEEPEEPEEPDEPVDPDESDEDAGPTGTAEPEASVPAPPPFAPPPLVEPPPYVSIFAPPEDQLAALQQRSQAAQIEDPELREAESQVSEIPASDVQESGAAESDTAESDTEESDTEESDTRDSDVHDGAAQDLLDPSVDPPTPGPPLTPVDFTAFPPPIGLEPASLPPYQPRTGSLTPTGPTNFEALLEVPPRGMQPAERDADGPEGESVLDLARDSARHDEDDDAVDEVDRVFAPASVDGGGAAVFAAPSGPISTLRLSEHQPGLVDERPEHHPVFEIESAGLEPTALDLRAGRAARLFWLWFAANSSLVSLAVGATLFQFGMSLRQAIVAILAGVAISFLPLGLGTLAGKWSGQPTMVVSRASFGLRGNILPTVLAVLSRAFWGGVLLWMLAAAVGTVLVGAGLDAGLGATVWSLVGLVSGFAIATVIAIFGYGFVARLQLVLSIVTGAFILGAAILTAPYIDLETALTQGDGPWILVVSGAVLVFSFLGLAWVHSSADLARYQRPGSRGGSSMLWATFGATLPAFLLIGWGAMLAASDAELAAGLASAPLATIAGILPGWYPAPLLLAAALGLLSGAVLTIYSGGFALQALGVPARRSMTTLFAALLVLAVGAVLVFTVPDARAVLRDVATTLAVPVAAWAGIFAAEMMIRNRRFHAPSLVTRGGVYPDVRWVNLVALVVISVVGFGLTTAALPGLGWQGFFFALAGVPASDPLAASDIGVFVALVLGLVVPLVNSISVIRRQESTEP